MAVQQPQLSGTWALKSSIASQKTGTHELLLKNLQGRLLLPVTFICLIFQTSNLLAKWHPQLMRLELRRRRSLWRDGEESDPASLPKTTYCSQSVAKVWRESWVCKLHSHLLLPVRSDWHPFQPRNTSRYVGRQRWNSCFGLEETWASTKANTRTTWILVRGEFLPDGEWINPLTIF